jgi:PIN domain nuclease of toxin-antitoxin system
MITWKKGTRKMNRYLLDSHTFLWAVKEADSGRLSEKAREVIEDDSSEILISPLTIYELGRKYHLGKLPEYAEIAKSSASVIKELGATELPLTSVHTDKAAGLDWKHKDPFDRLIAAQAITESIPLITIDESFKTLPELSVVW